MDQAIIPGTLSNEVAFFHRRSKTLILADTIMNFELDRIRQPYRFIARLCRIYYPSGGISPDLRLALWPSQKEVQSVYERVLAWNPESIILSHGRCFETNGTAAIRRAFSWAFLKHGRATTISEGTPKRTIRVLVLNEPLYVSCHPMPGPCSLRATANGALCLHWLTDRRVVRTEQVAAKLRP